MWTERYVWTGPGPRCWIGGHSFVRRLITHWKRGNDFNMPFHGEARGEGNMTLQKVYDYLKKRDMSRFRKVFLQTGENDIEKSTVGQLSTLMILIYQHLKRQSVDSIVFGEIFPRHKRNLNKKIHKLNTVLSKKHAYMIWRHGDLAYKEAVSQKDHIHLEDDRLDDFQRSIAMAFQQ